MVFYDEFNLYGRAARDFASTSCCEQMVTEPTHIDGEVPDLVLTDVPDVVGVRVGLPVGTSHHSAVIMAVPLLVYRQEFYLKNSVDWELVREDAKGLNWNEIIRCPCPVL